MVIGLSWIVTFAWPMATPPPPLDLAVKDEIDAYIAKRKEEIGA